ncbi:MAG: FtsX-like permease family protein [Actinomycetaceae bacterium]|nr:FtsX-like permease family protein [Actinomycetaceae bacterium]
MRQLLTANLRTHWQRYTAATIAIALATAFIVVCFGIISGLRTSIERNLAEETRGADIVVRNYEGSNEEIEAAYNKLQNDPQISELQAHRSTHINFTASGQNGYGELKTLPTGTFTPPGLKEGKYPTKPGEGVIVDTAAKAYGLKLGSTLTADVTTYQEEPVGQEQKITITGITKSGAASFNTIYLLPQDMEQLLLPINLINLKTNADTAHVENLIGNQNLKVATQTDDLNQRLAQMTEGQASITTVLMVFPALAAITAAIVISTTFQVMLTQRKRELALLRAIGADRTQVRKLVARETLSVGLIAAAIGTLLGIAGAIAVNLSAGIVVNNNEAIHAIHPTHLAIAFTAGILIAIAAGYAPARRASKLSPMEALANNETTSEHKRYWVRAGLATILIGTSTILIALSRYQISEEKYDSGFLLAFAGGALGFLGALILLSFISANLTGSLGRLIGKRSITSELAAENTYRNRGRTGATVTALVLGITLVTMMLTGATTMEHTLVSELNERRPFDLIVEKPSGISEEEQATISSNKNIKTLVALEGLNAEIEISGPNNKTVPDATIYQDTNYQNLTDANVDKPKPGQIAVNGYLWEDNMRISVRVGQQQWELKPIPARTPGYTVAAETYQQLKTAGANSQTRAVLAAYTDDTTTSDLTKVLNEVGEKIPDSTIEGGGWERLNMLAVIKGILIGAVAMLAVSVIVALVGVSNTLSLSVIERQRENALLRAVGMTRASMRQMLVVEALLISMIALVVGFALGIGFGWLGAISLAITDIPIRLIVPWLPLLGVTAVTAIAAILASILPGRRAANASPVEALAHT